MAEGGELRLAVPADGAVPRIFAITRLDLVNPLFSSLDEALARGRRASRLASTNGSCAG